MPPDGKSHKSALSLVSMQTANAITAPPLYSVAIFGLANDSNARFQTVCTPKCEKNVYSSKGYTVVLWDQASAEALFQACADRSDPRAWQEFARRYGLLLERTAYRIARRYIFPTRELLDDLVQECYLRLCADDCKALRVFRSTRPDSEFGYLKVIASHAVLDHFRRKNGGIHISIENAPEPRTDAADIDRAVLLREVRECLKQVTAGSHGERDSAIFYLYYLQGITAKAISHLPTVDLSCEGVESLLGRLRRALRECLGLSKRPLRPQDGEAA